PGVSCAQVARELGIEANVLSRWKREAAAGKESALRSARYPELSAKIKRWVQEHPHEDSQSARQATMAKRAATRPLRDRIEALTIQRDKAAARLLDAEAEIVRLLMRIASLEAQLPTPKLVTKLPQRSGQN